MGKYKWSLGVGGFCGLGANMFHTDVKNKVLRRLKRKRNADSLFYGSGIKLVIK